MTHPLCPASFSTKQKIWPTAWFQNKNKAAIWQEWKETGSSNCHTQVYFWTGCVMALLITVYLMRPSGHVLSHSEKSARLHCWTRLQEASSVMCLKVTRTVSMRSRRWFWSLEEAASCCILLLTRLSAVYSPCRSAWWKHTHMHWSDPSQSGSHSRNTPRDEQTFLWPQRVRRQVMEPLLSFPLCDFKVQHCCVSASRSKLQSILDLSAAPFICLPIC